MAKSQWTDIEIFDCDVAGFRVAMALAVSTNEDLDPGSVPTDLHGILKHCTGSLRCGSNLPAVVDDVAIGKCPMVKFLRQVIAAAKHHRAPLDPVRLFELSPKPTTA